MKPSPSILNSAPISIYNSWSNLHLSISNRRRHAFSARIIKACLLTCTIILASCTNQPNGDNWPKNIPQRSYFINYYQLDEAHQLVLKQEHYLEWVKRFYLGWELYRRGWIRATEELTATLNNEKEKEKDEFRAKMLNAGHLIAPEWAKNKGYRVINTRHVVIWGNTLRASIERDEQMKILDSILIDIDNLLNKSISPGIIKPDRYFTPEPFGLDIDF